ncbi:hypothetical protein L1987_57993 [Smallanthus sonchifolius]|uniref:Uncharacterized protein n=1 Tax=Smallanthus sonchifolius TaxID=185202 RepID=A0ACB9DF28_9ASTR|nr:hypothetical protein L1987_57993 [Smallanthus sonchifolius]
MTSALYYMLSLLQGVAWVGNTYLKFEAMCLEVQEAMCEEVVKYVEIQVQTVGASMKRFCSDIMHDLIPPSSIDGIHKKPISSNKEDSINLNPACIKGISEKNSNSNHDGSDDLSAISFNWDISDDEEASGDWIVMQVSNKTHDATIFSNSSIIRSEHTAVCNQDFEDEIENNTSMQMMEPIGHESKSGFEETCVLVDGDDYVLDDHKEKIRQSYKKKIQKAFSLARRQEYKQQVIVEEKLKCEEAIITPAQEKKSTLESDWELL